MKKDISIGSVALNVIRVSEAVLSCFLYSWQRAIR